MEGEPQNYQQPNEAPTPEQQAASTPRIYVASLSDYNAGRLHGNWIDAAQEPEELLDAVAAMLAASPMPGAEEWAIHDYEGFNGLALGEHESLESVAQIAAGIAEHGLAFAHWANLIAGSDEFESFSDAYLGHWPTVTHYAEDILSDLGLDELLDTHIPDNLRPYVKVDAEAFGRDLELGGDISAIEGEGGVYVFSSVW